jgi:subtilisin family serine protease
MNILIVLGLILADVAIGLPGAAVSSQAQAAASPPASEGMSSPALAGKRAKVKRQRRQDDRQETKQDRKKDRKQADRKQDRNQADRKDARKIPDRKLNRQDTDSKPKSQDTKRRLGAQQEAGKAVEIGNGVLPNAAAVAPQQSNAEDRYIVLLADGANDAMQATNEIAGSVADIKPTHVYEHVFNGFAAVIPDDQLEKVKNDSRVLAVVPDVVGYPGEQTLTTGITRINGHLDRTANIDGFDDRVNVDVAVLDTAGNDFHPDLNIFAWSNCTDDQVVDHDVDGHGTHVGGSIGALDNDFGVVGVAPGARLWNIKVMRPDDRGRSFYFGSWVICGLDLVAQYATDQGDGLGDIEVANASLGGNGGDSNCQTDVNDLFHQAFCRTVAAGVPVVVAAMNNAGDAANTTPATYPEVITVSALADSDGRPGGRGPDTPRGPDESLASFSNFGADVDIAAPGVNVLSTVPTGGCVGGLCDPSGFKLSDGTSMAAPHVAGAAALYLATHPGASPAQVKSALLDKRERIALINDRDGRNEGVLRVAGVPPVASPPPPTDSASSPSEDQKKKKKKHKKGKRGKKKR